MMSRTRVRNVGENPLRDLQPAIETVSRDAVDGRGGRLARCRLELGRMPADGGSFRGALRLTRSGGRVGYAAFFTECRSSNSTWLL
jgi:hypothetical protein